VPSWSATTPAGTLVQVAVRGVSVSGRRSSWDVVGRWAGTDATFRRTSLGPQRDDLAHVAGPGGAGLVTAEVEQLFGQLGQAGHVDLELVEGTLVLGHRASPAPRPSPGACGRNSAVP